MPDLRREIKLRKQFRKRAVNCLDLHVGQQGEVRAATKGNTMLRVKAAPTFQGCSLFPNIFKYNRGHSDSINKSNQNELKEAE